MRDQQTANMASATSEESEVDYEDIDDEDVPFIKGDMFDSTEEEDEEAAYRAAKRSLTAEPTPQQKVIFEHK